MLLVLSHLATANHENAIYLMNCLYSWIIIETCDSCLEKTLYFDHGYSNNIYDLLSHPSNEYTAVGISGFDAEFVTFACGIVTQLETTVIPRLTHSGIKVRAHRDISAVTVWDPETNVKTECTMPTCYCLVIKTLTELVVRACRGASLGRDGIVSDWFKIIYSRNGNLDLVDQYMIKLILMYKFLPTMANAIKNYFMVLYYGIISDVLLQGAVSPISYNDVSAALLFVEPVDRRGILQYCFQPHISLAKIQTFLRANKRHERLTECITQT